MEKKNIEEMNVIELKAVLFDIDNEIKQRQNAYQQIAIQLENKIKEKPKKLQDDKKPIK